MRNCSGLSPLCCKACLKSQWLLAPQSKLFNSAERFAGDGDGAVNRAFSMSMIGGPRF
jgi:hypothetical protein